MTKSEANRASFRQLLTGSAGRTASLAVLTALLAVPGAALAQAEPEAETNSQDIIVTAQRRSERLLDVPMSVTALTSETLEKSGVISTSDLGKVTPGLQMTYYGSNLQPSIRGVTSTGGNLGDNPSVAMYLDGIYQAQQIAAVLDLPDVDQIEVLKGPQGTLYGQNATGGAIIITTRAPGFEPTGKASVSYGTYNDIAARAFISLPVADDTVAFSLAGAYQDRDGFRRQVATGKRDWGLHSEVVRAKVLVQPSDAAKVTFTAYYANRSDSAPYASVALNNNSLGYAIFPNAPKVTRPAKQFGGVEDVHVAAEAYGFSGRAEVDLGAGTLNWISSYSRTKVDALADLDASPVNLVEYRYKYLIDKTQLHEVNFASQQFGALSFIVGALYMKIDSAFDQGHFLLRTPSLMPAPRLPVTLDVAADAFVKKEVMAAYGEVTFEVTDALTISAGGRYTEDKQRGFSNAIVPGTTIACPCNPVKATNFSPRVTVRYELDPDSNVYATFAKGFKGGIILNSEYGAVPTPSDETDPIVKPEKITAYEVGYKGRPIDNVTLSLAGFWYDYKNLQVSAYRAPVYLTQNAATVRGKGLEASLDWAVTPDFTLSGGATWLDAKFRSFPAAQGYQSTGVGNTPIIIDLSGHRLLRSPKLSATASANYEAETAAGTIGAYVSMLYNSGMLLENTGRIKQDSYATVDAQLSFGPASVEGLRFVLWGKNLTNTAYWNNGLISDFGDAVSYGEPRTYGVRAEFEF